MKTKRLSENDINKINKVFITKDKQLKAKGLPSMTDDEKWMFIRNKYKLAGYDAIQMYGLVPIFSRSQFERVQ